MADERQKRRAAQRRRVRRQRSYAAGSALLVIVVAAIALAAAGGGSSTTHDRVGASTRPHAIVPGGPLAPASVGGLAALWAPQNVVGSQPGTAAAYEGASKLPALPGYILIADRGNNRMLVVD